MPKLNLVFIWLFQKLYPPARAWWMTPPIQTGEYLQDADGVDLQDTDGNFLVTADYSATGGWFYRLHRAIGIQFAILWNAARSIQYAQLPDNPYFTQADANDWYRRLGIYNSGLVSLDDMKAAIRQRISFPASPLDQQHYLYVQTQLRAAGFDVYVFENRFPSGGTFITHTPDEIVNMPVMESYLGGFYLGDSMLGTTELLDGISLIANYLEDENDAGITLSNLRSTFFIGYPTLLNPTGIGFATIPEARHVEFRQLLMKLKSKHTIGILFINYT